MAPHTTASSSSRPKNKVLRSTLLRRSKSTATKSRLSSRLQRKASEKEDPSLRHERLRKAREGGTKTIENTKEWIGYGNDDDDDGDEEDLRGGDEEDDEEDSREGGLGERRQAVVGGEAKKGMKRKRDDLGDPRTRPAKLKMMLGEGVEGTENDQDGQGSMPQIDLGSLASLFPSQTSSSSPPHEASTSTNGVQVERPVGSGKLLLTTSPPRPSSDQVMQFLKEVVSFFGGEDRVDCRPRKDSRWDMKRIAKWSEKRGYRGLLVLGVDKGEPTSLTVSLLPYGPTAFFRLTSVQLAKQIRHHAVPTRHAPDLVLSNFTTPLGLSVGMMFQELFPKVSPTPSSEEQEGEKKDGEGEGEKKDENGGVSLEEVTSGRQVVLVACQRDFVFFRRFRYMFDIRSEMAVKMDRQGKRFRGEDHHDVEDLRARFQEIGPRFTLKLRWVRKGGMMGVKNNKNEEGVVENGKGGDENDEKEELEKMDVDEIKVKENGDVDMNNPKAKEEDSGERPISKNASSMPTSSSSKKAKKKRKLSSVPATNGNDNSQQDNEEEQEIGRGIRIPNPPVDGLGGLAAFNKVHTAKQRMDNARKRNGKGDPEWEWHPRMQVSRRKFFM